MLKVLRDNLRHFHWVLWIVIAAFILLYIPDFMAPGGGPSSAAAMVGDQEISYEELRQSADRLERQFRETYGQAFTPELADQLNLPRQAFDQLVNQKILLLEARRLGLAVTDGELSEEILELFRDADGKFVGQEQYGRILRGNGYTIQQFEENMREDLLVQKLLEVLRSNLYVPEEEVEEAYRETVERANIRYLQVPAGRFSDEVEVSDEEIRTYYEENQGDFQLPERRDLGYLLVDVNRLRQTLDIDEGRLFAYYEENEDDFVKEAEVRARHILRATNGRSAEEARREIEEIRARIEGGETFAEVAREMSEDPGSAPNGGDLGFFGPGQMTPEFEQAAFDAEPGALVGPVETPFGIHLILVEDRREGGPQAFAEVRSEIRARLAAEEAPEAAAERATALEEELRAGEVSAERMRALAESAGDAVTFTEPQPVAEGGAVAGLGRAPQLMDRLFELEPGQLSEPVELPRGQVLVYLKEILEPRQESLDEVKPRIRTTITADKRKTLALERLAEAKERLEKGEAFDTVATDLGVTPAESGEFGPQGTIRGLGYNAKVARAALSMEEGEVGGPFETAQGAVIFEVIGRTEWDPEGFAEQRQATRQQLEDQRLNQLLSSMVQERQRQVTLQIFDENLREQFQS